jgi:hypothetical protein
MKGNYTINLLPVFVIIFLFTGASISISGKDYYVSSRVLQSGDGTRSAPFKTIQEAASIMLPGDYCYIDEGTYPETVIPLNSGRKGAPLTFQPWHSNDEVRVTGLNRVEEKEWVPYGDSFYRANVTLDLQHENQVFSA